MQSRVLSRILALSLSFLVILTVIAPQTTAFTSLVPLIKITPENPYELSNVSVKVLLIDPFTQTIYNSTCNLTVITPNADVMFFNKSGEVHIFNFTAKEAGEYTLYLSCDAGGTTYQTSRTFTAIERTVTINAEPLLYRNLTVSVEVFPPISYPITLECCGVKKTVMLDENGRATTTLGVITGKELLTVEFNGRIINKVIEPKLPTAIIQVENTTLKPNETTRARIILVDDKGELNVTGQVELSYTNLKGPSDALLGEWFTVKATPKNPFIYSTGTITGKITLPNGLTLNTTTTINIQAVVVKSFTIKEIEETVVLITAELEKQENFTVTLYVDGKPYANKTYYNTDRAELKEKILKAGLHTVYAEMRTLDGCLIAVTDTIFVFKEKDIRDIPEKEITLVEGGELTIPYLYLRFGKDKLWVYSEGNDALKPSTAIWKVTVIVPTVKLKGNELLLYNIDNATAYCKLEDGLKKIAEAKPDGDTLTVELPAWSGKCQAIIVKYEKGSYKSSVQLAPPTTIEKLKTVCYEGETCIPVEGKNIVFVTINGRPIPKSGAILKAGTYEVKAYLKDGSSVEFKLKVINRSKNKVLIEYSLGDNTSLIKIEGTCKFYVTLNNGLTVELGEGEYPLDGKVIEVKPVSDCTYTLEERVTP